ncbi:MAG: nucleoside-diphosphate sugar epimerase/dehydratase [Polyangiales bacterium]
MSNGAAENREVGNLPQLVFSYRRVFVVLVHLALWAGAFIGAFLLRFDARIPAPFWALIRIWLPVALAIRTAVYFYFGMFHGLWRYTGARDLVTLFQAASVSTMITVLYVHFVGPLGLPRTVFVLEWLMSIFAVGGLRFSVRTLREISHQVTVSSNVDGRKKILIVGAGDGGEMLMRELTRTHGARYECVGFVDDNPAKRGERIHNVPVLGPIASVPDLVSRHEVDEVIVAIPSASGREMRRIVGMCSKDGVRIRTIPGVESLIEGRVTVSQLRNVAIEDLLGRDPVKLETELIAARLNGAVVMITGAGGSIGSEMCRQVCRFGPSKLLLVEQAENALFQIHRELREAFPEITLVPQIADICDTRRMEALFSRHRPNVVFHAAAHKHVPMMEWNAGEAIKNNVFGTRKVADLADQYGVQSFVMISTDKAVNPTSVMGVSKRVAEIYIQSLSQRSQTKFITVRFGNVLGSNGSVVPIFQEQIARGGPVTVTHPDMKRYFMTIPEASQLVLQAGVMGDGGEIFVLDMGEPVKIVDLARDLITLSGLRPGEDIEIAFAGIRPGEKLFEELAADDEHADKTRHPKIFVGRFRPYDWEQVETGMAALHECSDGADDERVRLCFKQLVPEYNPVVLSGPPGTNRERRVPTMPAAAPDERANVIPLKRG